MDELENGHSDDDGKPSGAEDDKQMAPNGGPEDSQDLYKNDLYTEISIVPQYPHHPCAALTISSYLYNYTSAYL